MQVSIPLSTAKELFNSTTGAATSKLTGKEIYNYIYCRFDGEQATVVGSDSQSVHVKTAMVISEPLTICLEASKLHALIASYTDTSKDITLDFSESQNGKVKIKYGRSKPSITSLTADQYPLPDAFDNRTTPEFSFSVTAGNFLTSISRSTYAKAIGDVRTQLNHLCIEIKNGVARLVCTDGHRLANANFELAKGADQRIVLPSPLAEKLLREKPSHETLLTFEFDSRNFICKFGNTFICSKFVENNFPDVSRFDSLNIDHRVTVARGSLVDAVSRIRSFLNNSKLPRLTINLLGNVELSLSADDIDEFVPLSSSAQNNDSEMTIAVNLVYLLDALKHIGSDDVCVSFISQQMLTVSDNEESNCRALIMGMR